MSEMLDTRGVVDHLLVMRLRIAVSERMAEEGGVEDLDLDSRRALTQSLVADQLGPLRREFIMAGNAPLGPEDENALAMAVDAAMWGPMRFAYRADDPTIENLIFRGAQHVVVYRSDGTISYEQSPFTSAEDLCLEAEGLTVRCGAERPWNDATSPFVDLRLPDASRFTGVRGCAHPTVFIRRPRVFDMDLQEMVANGTISDPIRQFIGATAGTAEKTIVFAGPTNSGKTTMARATCHCFGPDEHVVTIENVRELGLEMFRDRHRNITECEARPANGEGKGAITIADWVQEALRMKPDRIVNGEVLGDEVVAMLKALSQGHGGLTTIHTKKGRAEAVVRRMCALAGSAPEQLPFPNTESLIPDAIDFVVLLRRVEDLRARRFYRTVASIHEIRPVQDGPYIHAQMSTIFDSPDARTVRACPTGILPDCLDELEAAGFDPGLLQSGEGGWRR